ncbi:MAG: hypothetical protein OJF51_001055 [Nitrospira sp.]|nr:MAG: hypothetical protein OJF51_001055 [Nitrospira sp.]
MTESLKLYIWLNRKETRFLRQSCQGGVSRHVARDEGHQMSVPKG